MQRGLSRRSSFVLVSLRRTLPRGRALHLRDAFGGAGVTVKAMVVGRALSTAAGLPWPNGALAIELQPDDVGEITTSVPLTREHLALIAEHSEPDFAMQTKLVKALGLGGLDVRELRIVLNYRELPRLVIRMILSREQLDRISNALVTG
jgi:hypothetical protein